MSADFPQCAVKPLNINLPVEVRLHNVVNDTTDCLLFKCMT